MNIYEMLDFIRKYDYLGTYTCTADFLNTQYINGRVESENLFYMFKDLMVELIQRTPYNPERRT